VKAVQSPSDYVERVFTVDLTTRSISESPLPSEYTTSYLGGRGVAARLLWDLIADESDPYAPGNPLILSTGTLTGTAAPMSGRATVTCISPATGRYFKANVGGHLGLALKLSGVDHLVVRGRAEAPVYLEIGPSGVAIREASELWGKTVRETTRTLTEAVGEGANVTCIGPAGENRVAFASIMTSCYNAAGRGGVGSVMGDKRLKAIAVARPAGTRTCADPQTFRSLLRETREALYADTMAASYYHLGTAAGISIKNEFGTLPSRNFLQGHVDPIEQLTSEYWNTSGRLTGKAGCAACLYSCHRHVRIADGPFAGTHSGGPEYESVCALGTGTGIHSLGALQRANELCNDLGLDTISTGTVIQWAMETAERGLLPSGAEGDIRFGSEESVSSLPRLIACREGIGDLLADGLKVAAGRIGGGSETWAMQARGLEQSGVETRCTMGYALAFAVNPRGPDHLHTECLAERGNTPEARELIERITGSVDFARADITEKRPEIVRWHEDIYAISDALGVCAFTSTAAYGMTPARLAGFFESLTGVRCDEEHAMNAGRRIITLERLLNLRLGWTNDPGDYAPHRILHEKMKDRSDREYALEATTLTEMVERYHAMHGWDEKTGEPHTKTLADLGLLELQKQSHGSEPVEPNGTP